MKRFGQFMLVFLVLLLFAYAYPVIFPKEAKPTLKKEEKTDVTISHTSFPYGKIEASGLAVYIGQSTEEFKKVYGEPLEIQTTALGYDWWILGEDERDYLQVAVKNGKVASIFALGAELGTEPFELGMNLTDISELTTVFSNFDFEKKDVHYKMELTEEDMNYRPLVAFDNDSFAILHLDQGTGKLIGIRYLNKSTLLRLMPYQLNEGQLADKVIDEGTDWQLVNEDSQRQLQSILTILRKRGKYPPYEYPKKMTEATQQALNRYMDDPTDVLDDKKRQEEWTRHESRYEFNQAFTLRSTEFDRIVALGNLNPKNVHGLLYSPGYDVPFLAMTWYSELSLQNQFTHVKDREVGISFYKDVVLFLFSESATETESSIEEQPKDLSSDSQTSEGATQ